MAIEEYWPRTFDFTPDPLTLAEIKATLLSSPDIFKERTDEEQEYPLSLHSLTAIHLQKVWPITFKYHAAEQLAEDATGDEKQTWEAHDRADRKSHWESLRFWVGRQVDRMRFLPRKGSELEVADGLLRDMDGRLLLSETAIHFVGTEPEIRIKVADFTESQSMALKHRDVGQGLERLRVQLAQLMGRGADSKDAPRLYFVRNGGLSHIWKPHHLTEMIQSQHSALSIETGLDFRCHLSWLDEHHFDPEAMTSKRPWMAGTTVHDPLDLRSVIDPSRWQRVFIPPATQQVIFRSGHTGSDSGQSSDRQDAGRVNFALITLLNRAGAPCERRVAFGIVRPYETDIIDTSSENRAPQKLIATAGWDPLTNTVQFRVREVDINLDPAAGAGPTATVTWEELQRRGMKPLGRFSDADEDEVRDFAYSLYHASKFDPGALPLRCMSPSIDASERIDFRGRRQRPGRTARLAAEAKDPGVEGLEARERARW